MNFDDDMELDDLIEKYEQMRDMGDNIYFDSEEFESLANYYYDIADISECELIVKQGLKMHPSTPQLLIIKAKILAFNTKYQDALDLVSTISKEDRNVDYFLVKVESMLHLMFIEEAYNVTLDAIKSRKLDGAELFDLLTEAGILFSDFHEFSITISLLERAYKIDNEDIELLYELSFAHEIEGNFDLAIKYYNELLDMDPYFYHAWVSLGKLHSMMLDHDKAIEAFDFALAIKEDEVDVMRLKAISLYFNDNLEEALRLFEICLEKSPNDLKLYDSLIEGYEIMEQYDEMMKMIQKKEIKFGIGTLYMERTHILLKQEKYEEAEKMFEKIPESLKDTFDYYVLEGELAIYHGDFEAAETAYMLAKLDDPINEDVINKLANISLEQNKYEKSADYLELLLILNPEYPTAKSRLAFIRFEIGAKEPFDKIMSQFTDEELRALLVLLTSGDEIDYLEYDREHLLRRLNEARENRVLFKNIKY